jgi:putative protein-disulfide isomerase
MKYTAWYCYDAWCGWCYGFSGVIKKLAEHYAPIMQMEVLSGGMILHDNPAPIGLIAPHIEQSYRRVEAMTGVVFGRDYLWHIENPDKSDWFPSSEKSAIALCVFKDFYPEQQMAFAASLQQALFFEGRDLCDDEAYRHLLGEYHIPANEFYQRLAQPEYIEKAHEEFALCRQLQVPGYPALLIQTSETRFNMVANGYTDFETVRERIDALLAPER